MGSQNEPILIKRTPFIFLKSLVIIEFFFALLPVLLAVLLNFTRLYNESALADLFSYNLFSVLALTAVQVLSLTAAFMWWYVPTYQIDQEQIILLRRNLLADSTLAQTQTVIKTAVHFGPLGKRFDYGNVLLLCRQQSQPIKLSHISDPAQVARQIEGLVKVDTAVLPSPPLALDKPIPQLISAGESQYVEFKSSFLWDYKRGNANKALHIPVFKNITAFMNTAGGVLLIGVADDGKILGLKPDFKLMKKKDADGWENNFNMAFNRMVGPEFRQYVDVRFVAVEDKVVSVLGVRPSPEPVYLNVNGKEDFYIKTGNASQPLSVRQANNYIQTRFAA
ncbi:MAG: ATP-binding protein [Chloroflexi bacterium]|nr:ATP-binding protein [Chloroflexota bacterium]